MIRTHSLPTVASVAAAVILLAGLAPAAQAVLAIDWFSIDGGGATVASASLVLYGTIGQADADVQAAGTYVLKGGFRAISHCAVSDVDEDGYVDVVDLLYLVDTFGLARGDPGYNSACDFNSDGYVDVVDLLLLVEYFGT
jgi:hypothetical protein